MRIGRFQLAGLAAALAGASAGQAAAADVTVDTATTTPLATSSPDGASPGDVTITASGSITVTSGAAVTIDSDNSVANAGSLNTEDASDSTGILIGGGFTGSATNTGVISLTETYVLADADGDGDLDGAFAEGANRRGIWLQSGATFTGDIDHASSGQIAVEGNNSAGIELDALLTGNLSALGATTVVGDNSRGVLVNAGVTGDVAIGGSIAVRGENAAGAEIIGPVGGALTLSGSISVSGFHSTARPASQAVSDALDADDLLIGGPAVAVRGDVGGGVLVRGVGVEDDADDDGDGVTEADGDANDDATANITSFGTAPALLIAPDAASPADMTLSATASGYGLHNRGALNASGVYDGFDATVVRIEGAGGAEVAIAGGVLNDGSVSAIAFEADAYGYFIGDGASAPEFINRASVASRVTSENADVAYGLVFDEGAVAGAVRNTGVINILGFGEDVDAIAIIDRSGTVTSVINSGSILAQLVVSDPDTSDDVTPVANGRSVAVDLSAATAPALFRQEADTPFTDDDDVDNDAASRPAVFTRGDILMGAGADTVELFAGAVVGDVSFGLGADSFVIDNGATFLGRLDDADGALTIDVIEGLLAHGGGATELTSAHFGAASELAVLVSDDPDESTLLDISGTAVFDPGAVITPVIPAGLPESGTTVFLTAGALSGADNVTRVITGAGAPYIYNLTITTATTNTPDDSLAAVFVLKSPAELGLNANQSAAFTPVVDAMRLDDEASAALASLNEEADFLAAYQQLLPDYSSAGADIAATAIKEAQAASSNRLARTRLSDVDHASVWVQEIAYGLSRDPKTFGVEYRGSGFGFAAGLDGPLDNGALLGFSGAFIASEVEEPGRRDGQVSAWFGQLNGYFGTGLGWINLDLVTGLGAGRMKSARFVDIGDDFSRTAEAEWWAYEGHAAARASAPLRLGSRFVVTPRLGLTYVSLSEDEYVEQGGGAAINLDVDGADTQRLWGDVGVDFAWRFGGDRSSFEPRVSYTHRLNIIKDPAERTLRFASGGADFTLTDEKPGDGGPVVGLGFDSTNGWSTISLMYEGEFGDQIERHSLNAAVRFRF